MVSEDQIHVCLNSTGDPTVGFRAETKHRRNRGRRYFRALRAKADKPLPKPKPPKPLEPLPPQPKPIEIWE